ncbi:MAG: hypothetical protein HYS09_09030 [Chloroflexi bacterium]|nr:hypothetical protein [Chloroflexota bacterium]
MNDDERVLTTTSLYHLVNDGGGAVVPALMPLIRAAFDLSYTLRRARSDFLLVTRYYAFLPAIAAGDSSRVTVITPVDSDWSVALEPAECEQSGPQRYSCGVPQGVQVAALVEVSQPSAIRSIKTNVSLSNVELPITISFFPGEEAWAARIRELAGSALPLLEELFGYPYEGPAALQISQRGRQDVAGYEGTFSCTETACDIGISPIADDRTALHEFAHLWTNSFESRWLAEGFAEVMARRAADQLGPLITTPGPPSPGISVDFPLDEWGPIQYIVGASEEALAREQSGYEKSVQFVAVLEQTLGLGPLQHANSAASGLGTPVDSRRYLDLLEDTTGTKLDALFLQWVFPQSMAPVLALRREARDRLAALEKTAKGLGLEVPGAIASSMADWHFENALADIGEAEDDLALYLALKPRLDDLRTGVKDLGLSFPSTFDEAIADWRFEEVNLALDEVSQALTAYRSARKAVERARNFWQRLGLIAEDPDGRLEEAAEAFNAGNFNRALAKAHEAQELIVNAEEAALFRLLVAVGAFAAVLSAGVGWYWWRRRRAAPALEGD